MLLYFYDLHIFWFSFLLILVSIGGLYCILLRCVFLGSNLHFKKSQFDGFCGFLGF